MYHTTVGLHDNRILLYGGRLSPAKANGCCHILSIKEDSGEWKKLEIDGSPEPRWRHTATPISANNG